MVQRPSFAQVKAAKAALPEEEKVEKIKAQFKDGAKEIRPVNFLVNGYQK